MPKEPLTEIRALELCRDLWRWIEANVARFINDGITASCSVKAAWPGMNQYGPLECGCPCCEFATVREDACLPMDCSKCPLIKLWPLEGYQKSHPLNACPCINHEAAYLLWQIALGDKDAELSISRAKTIADAAEARLKELKG